MTAPSGTDPSTGHATEVPTHAASTGHEDEDEAKQDTTGPPSQVR